MWKGCWNDRHATEEAIAAGCGLFVKGNHDGMVLIYWITTGSPGSNGGRHATTAVARFSDEAACKSAFVAMQKIKSNNEGLWGVCVPSQRLH
jgi:hypothetical protein